MISLIRKLANRLVQKEQVKKEQKEQLQRNQKRKIERYESEAMNNANSLCEKFVDFLFNLDAKDAHLINDEIKNLIILWVTSAMMQKLSTKNQSNDELNGSGVSGYYRWN